MKLILASNSPRRRELLSKLDYPFEVIPSDCEEITTSVIPTDIVKDLATLKAREVFASHPDCVVIGCDTVVDFNGEIMGKPKSHADASRMLHALSGKTHYVHTGVCILSPMGDCKHGFAQDNGSEHCQNLTVLKSKWLQWLFCESTKVVFRNLSDKEIADYIDAGFADGKAGAYGIQDESCFAASYVGDFDNVVGLPTYRVQQILSEIYKR